MPLCRSQEIKSPRRPMRQQRNKDPKPYALFFLLLCCLVWISTPPLHGREKDTTQYGAGLIVNLPFPAGTTGDAYRAAGAAMETVAVGAAAAGSSDRRPG